MSRDVAVERSADIRSYKALVAGMIERAISDARISLLKPTPIRLTVKKRNEIRRTKARRKLDAVIWLARKDAEKWFEAMDLDQPRVLVALRWDELATEVMPHADTEQREYLRTGIVEIERRLGVE